MKLEKENLEKNPEESQDIKSLQKELKQFSKILKQKRITLGYIPRPMWRSPWGFSLGRCSAKCTLILGFFSAKCRLKIQCSQMQTPRIQRADFLYTWVPQDLSMCGFWYIGGSWNQSPTYTER
uniref:Uncharacterized protein n=1 Tax=Prolemur simus TaxID=1328070 RepID=A0A8C9A9W9_PROSS